MRHPKTAVEFGWDEGNDPKLALRGIRPPDVEAVFWQGDPEWRRNKASGTGDWFMIGADAVDVGWSWSCCGQTKLRASSEPSAHERTGGSVMTAAHDDDYERAEALLDQFEADPGVFEVDDGGEQDAPREDPIRLSAAISVRFDADTTARLRAAAADLDLGYTSLVRRFVTEGLDRMEGLPTPTAIHRRVLLDVEVTPAGDVTVSTSRVA